MNSFAGSLTEHAYRDIRDKILRGELPFGAPLSRRGLAEELGISIVPVGDALQRLESEGLVESRPRVGTRVRIPTTKTVRGHFVLREALETQSARIFAEKASSQEREEILARAAELDRLYQESADEAESSRDSLYHLHQIHMQFHMRIAECSGCDELCQAIEKNQVLIFNWLYDIALGNPAPVPRWHAQLAEALVSGDPLIADAAMRRHTSYRMEELLQQLALNPNWNDGGSEAFTKRPRRRNQPVGVAGSERS
jgi:GntR family transcriptional regulator, rspAB operon transcriptional repressor